MGPQIYTHTLRQTKSQVGSTNITAIVYLPVISIWYVDQSGASSIVHCINRLSTLWQYMLAVWYYSNLEYDIVQNHINRDIFQPQIPLLHSTHVLDYSMWVIVYSWVFFSLHSHIAFVFFTRTHLANGIPTRTDVDQKVIIRKYQKQIQKIAIRCRLHDNEVKNKEYSVLRKCSHSLDRHDHIIYRFVIS